MRRATTRFSSMVFIRFPMRQPKQPASSNRGVCLESPFVGLWHADRMRAEQLRKAKAHRTDSFHSVT